MRAAQDTFRSRRSRKLVYTFVLFGSMMQAQNKQNAAPPSPTLFATAKTVFLGYAGSDSPEGHRKQGELYQQTLQAISATGRYRTVFSPADADLCMAVSQRIFVSPVSYGSSLPTYFVRLSASDCKTHAVLWTFDEEIRHSLAYKDPEKDLSRSMAAFTTDLNALADGKLP